MACADALKVLYGTHMLSEEAEYWWDNARQTFEANDYAAKFEKLSRLWPYYNVVEVEVSKCIKFENGLRLEIKHFIGYQEIRQFSMLVNKCCIYYEDRRARSDHYKSVSGKKNGDQSRGKLYATPVAKEDHKTHHNTASGKGTSEGGAHTPIKCFKCEELGHRALECTAMKYFKCEELGHRALECTAVKCFKCRKQGHHANE
ncbi:uncharacterized protein LOC127130088 [Lathyrus oleraceus]|uniref:uncharacterized protein LOC127130088 n=1 Tax=Pisum sativum TaxID=3888 RepID=UPI0021D13AC9|nr:uncharacterized protein LOC127130088 [Pisum sativum]